MPELRSRPQIRSYPQRRIWPQCEQVKPPQWATKASTQRSIRVRRARVMHRIMPACTIRPFSTKALRVQNVAEAQNAASTGAAFATLRDSSREYAVRPATGIPAELPHSAAIIATLWAGRERPHLWPEHGARVGDWRTRNGHAGSAGTQPATARGGRYHARKYEHIHGSVGVV